MKLIPRQLIILGPIPPMEPETVHTSYQRGIPIPDVSPGNVVRRVAALTGRENPAQGLSPGGIRHQLPERQRPRSNSRPPKTHPRRARYPAALAVPTVLIRWSSFSHKSNPILQHPHPSRPPPSARNVAPLISRIFAGPLQLGAPFFFALL